MSYPSTRAFLLILRVEALCGAAGIVSIVEK
jgi:hypothetical protein